MRSWCQAPDRYMDMRQDDQLGHHWAAQPWPCAVLPSAYFEGAVSLVALTVPAMTLCGATDYGSASRHRSRSKGWALSKARSSRKAHPGFSCLGLRAANLRGSVELVATFLQEAGLPVLTSCVSSRCTDLRAVCSLLHGVLTRVLSSFLTASMHYIKAVHTKPGTS